MIVWWTHSRMKAKFSPERIEELRFECPFMVGANYRNCWFGQRFTVNIRAHINHRVEPSDNTGECSYLLACFLRLEKFDKYVARILFNCKNRVVITMHRSHHHTLEIDMESAGRVTRIEGGRRSSSLRHSMRCLFAVARRTKFAGDRVGARKIGRCVGTYARSVSDHVNGAVPTTMKELTDLRSGKSRNMRR